MSEEQDYLRVVKGEKFYRVIDCEGALVSWFSGLEIVANFSNPSPREIDGFANGEFELALNVINDIPWFCFRIFSLIPKKGFGRKEYRVILPWQECPFHASRIDPQSLQRIEELALEAEENKELRVATNVILLDFPSNTVLSLRRFTLSPFFTRKLFTAVLDTKAAHTSESYEQGVTATFDEFPVNAIGESSRVRCKSGD
ncbi:hypothetical protein [Anabaenopsis arnoldii]|uniref:Uncharacterized protein n=1 Tax=Anabaenopsis arnoldii TaxID=2152938 RepID=A0ABT5ANT4_9CYAN|nr:hypothetical protein [Anabaenopsis arnoldii]MDB9538988.1 hypothetical protein [Anabaenopsis arnoldii]MDH6091276.1 hypothetical protein [Anabaenopsis arnoldii]